MMAVLTTWLAKFLETCGSALAAGTGWIQPGTRHFRDGLEGKGQVRRGQRRYRRSAQQLGHGSTGSLSLSVCVGMVTSPHRVHRGRVGCV